MENDFDLLLEELDEKIKSTSVELNIEQQEETKLNASLDKINGDLAKIKQQFENSVIETQRIRADIASLENEYNEYAQSLPTFINSDTPSPLNTLRFETALNMVATARNAILNPNIAMITEASKYHYDNLAHLIEEVHRSTEEGIIKSHLKEIEGIIQSFAVTDADKLIILFQKRSSKTQNQADIFVDLVTRLASIEPNWSELIGELMVNIFTEQMQYHLSLVEHETDFVLGNFMCILLQKTLKRVKIVCEPIDPIVNVSSETIQRLFANFLDFVKNQQLTAIFIRSIFEGLVDINDWLGDERMSLEAICFEHLGEQWMSIEVEASEKYVHSLLNSATAFNSDSKRLPEFGYSIFTYITKLVKHCPRNLAEDQLRLFFGAGVTRVFLLVEQSVETFSAKAALEQRSLILNFLNVLNEQATFINEVYDCQIPDLVELENLMTQRFDSLMSDLMRELKTHFNRALQDYQQQEDLDWHRGSPSPLLRDRLSKALVPYRVVEQHLDDVLFRGTVALDVVNAIDAQLFQNLVLTVPWGLQGRIEQFGVDLDYLIEEFGPYYLRKLRSARVILTGKPDSLAELEITEEESERLIESKNCDAKPSKKKRFRTI